MKLSFRGQQHGMRFVSVPVLFPLLNLLSSHPQGHLTLRTHTSMVSWYNSTVYNLYALALLNTHIVVCPAEGSERARVVPRAHKDSLSLYPAELHERNIACDVNAFRQRNEIIHCRRSLDFFLSYSVNIVLFRLPKMFTSHAYCYPRALLLGTSYALLGVPSRTARNVHSLLPGTRRHSEVA